MKSDIWVCSPTPLIHWSPLTHWSIDPFRITDSLWGEPLVTVESPSQKASDAEL